MHLALALTGILGVVAPLMADDTPASLSRYQLMARETLEQLVNINTTDSVGNTTAAAEAMAERSADIEGGPIGAAMRGASARPPDPGSVSRLAQIPRYNALMRTTCVATMLAAGHAENALPQRASATVNCRLLPADSAEAVRQTLADVLADEAISITTTWEPRSAPASPLDPEVLRAVELITETMWPGVPVIPTMATGATDGLYLRNAGIPTYGVSGIFSDIDDSRAHGRDERIGVQQFFDGQEFLYRLVKALASAPVRGDHNE
jgi:acetylornithine deacetylase/succinyl-diaminopimelate desuccinylase-like protein